MWSLSYRQERKKTKLTKTDIYIALSPLTYRARRSFQVNFPNLRERKVTPKRLNNVLRHLTQDYTWKIEKYT
jgi:hypothetical protein